MGHVNDHALFLTLSNFLKERQQRTSINSARLGKYWDIGFGCSFHTSIYVSNAYLKDDAL
jgi:hypothetical protein